MKKKFLAIAGAVLMTAACGMTACVGTTESTDKNVKVYSEIELTVETYAFAISKENTELKTTVNAVLTEMKEDGSLEALINAYFDGSATFTYANKTETPQKDDFVVATNAYFPPFEVVDGKNFTGIDMEIAYKIATKLGKNLFILDMEFDSIISSVKTGESAIGMAGMTVTETRLEQVDFADGYYVSAQVITTLASDTTFADCKTAEDVENILKTKDKNYKLGTQNGTTGYMYSNGDADFGYDGFKNLTTKGFTTGALAMKDLQNGRLNAVILDKQPSIMIAESINQ